MKNKAFKLALTIVIVGALVFGASFAKADTNEEMIKALQALIQVLMQMVVQLQQQLARITPITTIPTPLPCVQEGSSPPLGPNYSNYQCCFDLVLCHNPGENGSICRKTCNPELRMLLWGPERLTIDGLGDYIADVAGGVSPYTYKWSITGPIVIYKWDPNTSSWVPDGNIPENKSSVTYKWTQEGIYKVTVTVTDSTKKTITDTLTVTVKPSYIY